MSESQGDYRSRRSAGCTPVDHREVQRRGHSNLAQRPQVFHVDEVEAMFKNQPIQKGPL